VSAALRFAAALAAVMAGAAHAALDLASMDRSVDACTDFYAFANKRWLDTATIPADKTAWGSFNIVDREAERSLVRAIERGRANPPPAGTTARRIIDFVASGLDEAAIEREGTKPVAGLLARGDAIDGAESLARALADLHARGIAPGFEFDVNPDPKDSTRYMAGLTQGGLGLPDRDYYFLEDERTQGIRAAYLRHIGRVLEADGDAPALAAAGAARILGFETELARASMTAVERRDIDKTYNPMSVAELARAAPGFPWSAYFAALGAPNLARVLVRQPAYLKRFAELAAERGPADWRPYVRWHVLRATSDKLDRRYESLHFDFYERTLIGTQAPPPRMRRVIDMITGRFASGSMAEALGQLYVDEAFPPEAKARMLQLVANVKEALRDRLKTVEWMTEETRARSLEKLSAMRVKMAYPDKWKDFSRADVGAHPFVENWMNANRFVHERNVGRIGMPVDRDEWRTSPHLVNAFYNPFGNEIVFPAAILQPPFFDPKADDAVNYGGIGMVIGHEITHGFDDRGRRFDKDGNLRDWWSEEDARRYKERARKIELQYGGYRSVDDIAVNGALTLGENISDIGGLRIAFLALQKAKAQAPQPELDGFTPDQRFFLSFAVVWRALMRPERQRVLLRTDGHSPSPLRVKGVVASMPEFARAFSCDAAKTLLPAAQRGDIW
jgi:predicted metalloendopeptidase